jgi:hypothetical protein
LKRTCSSPPPIIGTKNNSPAISRLQRPHGLGSGCLNDTVGTAAAAASLSEIFITFEKDRALRRAPNFNFDAAMTFASMDKIEAIIKATGATLWIEHDKALADALKKAPQFYD